jgi:DNA-directed RNA polymerase beta' subunit
LRSKEDFKLARNICDSCGCLHLAENKLYLSFDTKKSESHCPKCKNTKGIIDKEKLTKWINEEIYGCHNRHETERENAMRELLLKIERGYFDK